MKLTSSPSATGSGHPPYSRLRAGRQRDGIQSSAGNRATRASATSRRVAPSGTSTVTSRSPLWLAPGCLALALFAYLLALVPSEAAGRAYAAYGGVYILASLLWMQVAEGVRPDRYDLLGAAVCLAGAAIILFAPRAQA